MGATLLSCPGIRVKSMGVLQRAQYGLIKEYSFNHNEDPYII